MAEKKELIDSFNKLLASYVALYYKTSAYHWNVTGINFYALHGLFQDIYEDANKQIDEVGEKLRTLKYYPTANLTKLLQNSVIQVKEDKFEVEDMLKNTEIDCNLMADLCNSTLKLANELDEQGLVDYLGNRIDVHKKFSWMVRSSTK